MPADPRYEFGGRFAGNFVVSGAVEAHDAVVDFTMQVGSRGQTVVVTEEAPQVDTTHSSVGGLVEEQEVQDLPLNGRNWTDLTLMQPGIAKKCNLLYSQQWQPHSEPWYDGHRV
jgi:hypothetical protein